jgi:hypothetical protein
MYFAYMSLGTLEDFDEAPAHLMEVVPLIMEVVGLL